MQYRLHRMRHETFDRPVRHFRCRIPARTGQVHIERKLRTGTICHTFATGTAVVHARCDGRGGIVRCLVCASEQATAQAGCCFSTGTNCWPGIHTAHSLWHATSCRDMGAPSRFRFGGEIVLGECVDNGYRTRQAMQRGLWRQNKKAAARRPSSFQGMCESVQTVSRWRRIVAATTLVTITRCRTQ